MMNATDFESHLNRFFPTARVDVTESGASTWLHVLVGQRAFAIQVTPDEGIGFSEVDPFSDDADFEGHDEVFTELESVIPFLRSKLQA